MALPPDTLVQINSALSQLDHAEQEVTLAKRAGLHELAGGESLATADQDIAKQRAVLLRIKNTYFPNSP